MVNPAVPSKLDVIAGRHVAVGAAQVNEWDYWWELGDEAGEFIKNSVGDVGYLLAKVEKLQHERAEMIDTNRETFEKLRETQKKTRAIRSKRKNERRLLRAMYDALATQKVVDDETMAVCKKVLGRAWRRKKVKQCSHSE